MGRKIRVCKDFTYSSIIKEAILATRDKKATSSQIFTYITNKHPSLFKQSNSMTWKGNIRQLLSKNPEFVKLKKDEKSKLHYWKYVPLEEIIESEKDIMYRYTDNTHEPAPYTNQKQYNSEYNNYPNYYDQSTFRYNPPSFNYNPTYYSKFQQSNDYFYGHPNDGFGDNLPQQSFVNQDMPCENQNRFDYNNNKFNYSTDRRKNYPKKEKVLSSSEMFENIKNYEEFSQFGLFTNNRNYPINDDKNIRQDYSHLIEKENEWKNNQYNEDMRYQERDLYQHRPHYQEDRYYEQQQFEKKNLIEDIENDRGKIKFKFVNDMNCESNENKEKLKNEEIYNEEMLNKSNKGKYSKENYENKQK